MPCANDTLSPTQRAVMQAIVMFGRMAGFSDAQIQIAVQVAFIESSLGTNMQNSTSTATGLYQYTNGTWSDRHSELGERDIGNSIVAFYSDLAALQTRYDNGVSSGDIPVGVDFGEYVYMRHHDGWYFDDFANSPGIARFQSPPTFCLSNIPVDFYWYAPFADTGDMDFGYWDNFNFMQLRDTYYRRAGIVEVGDPETVPLGISGFDQPQDDFVVGSSDEDAADDSFFGSFDSAVSHDLTVDQAGRFDTLFLELPSDFLDGYVDIATSQGENDFLFLAPKFNGANDWLY